jgi:hypothetical protein
LQQNICKIIPAEEQNKKVIIDQIENMLKLMTSFDLRTINDKLGVLNPSLNEIKLGMEIILNLIKGIPSYKFTLDNILKILSSKATYIQVQEIEKQLSNMSQADNNNRNHLSKLFTNMENHIINMEDLSSKNTLFLENQSKDETNMFKNF